MSAKMKNAVAAMNRISARRASFFRCSGEFFLAMSGLDRDGAILERPRRSWQAAPRPRLGPLALAALLLLGPWACSKADSPPGAEGAGAVPAALDGAGLYDRHCARCHGPQGTGSDQGPPLVNRIYEPSHHPDAAFYRAVSHGVRAHHWHFGDMPALGGLSNADVTAIIAYVRGLQRKAGIN
jgi:mono/diheme cytochrome c family protein